MKLAIFGASGRTGCYLLDQAVAQGHKIAALIRNPANPSIDGAKLKVIKGDILDYSRVRATVEGSDVVISVFGPRSTKNVGNLQSEATKNIVRAMRELNVRRLIVQTSVGVGDSRRQAGVIFGKIILPFILKEVFADKETQETIVRESGLDWTIVRPTGLNDKRGKGLQAVKVVLDGGRVPLRISRQDVASFILQEAVNPKYLGKAPVIGTDSFPMF